MAHILFDVNGTLLLGDPTSTISPGDTSVVAIELGKAVAMDVGLGFAVREGGRTVAAGTVLQLLD